MILPVKPLQQINAKGFEVLYRELGVVDTVRFIQQFTGGLGDYTAERQKAMEADSGDLDELVERIRAHTAEGSGATLPNPGP